MSVLADTRYSLHCYGHGLPAPRLTWSKMDGVLSNSVIEGPDGSLHFSKISSIDEGRYRCRAENEYGIVVTEIRLDVEGIFCFNTLSESFLTDFLYTSSELKTDIELC